ncbi:uncharacterized protein LOC126667212 isoform X2 [Mercurialis annua]|uniref:uncharacterized protein LOC126667212 isoform X2 n=1 Tax=Mercurialis annua TaxID=3986 RepID=UPI0021603BB7|nr:uncharacterized protein LOC126667212 isoform X2 [Mercurialis annua]
MNTTANLHLKPPTPQRQRQRQFLHSNVLHNAFQFRKFRFYKRRRIKRTTTHLTVRNNLIEPFQSFLSQFPSQNSLDFLAPVLGLASGLTFYISQFKSDSNSNGSLIKSNIGEWILFTSPTPFNRFVFLRCPSISFERFENLNERLVDEDRHFVRLCRGSIQSSGGLAEEEELLEYQRVCVSTDDGGVISIDWPANLELREEHGLDTTLLLVPGTTEGSLDKNVREFVCDALKRGFFPLVVNPRGCAGSPLTTPRLFTAADSDDISTAIQFINKARPWTTLMGVGWGYGANILTKYLAEVGERTPLTASTCINNPFDLEEATRYSPDHAALDQKLAGGLIDILRSNKELFQGRTKGFDVEKALKAKSVRDFEKAVSMVSYGCTEIEDFYFKASTRDLVGNVKIPVLFIQNDNGTVPLFSTPRSLIAENPFTSLLLCSRVPSHVRSGRSAELWCQNATIEWLSAVELGILKGRHPLLKDVDITYNPSKVLTLMEGRTSEVLDDTSTALQSRSRQDSHRNLKLEEGLQETENGVLQQTSSIDAELVKEEVTDHVDTENGEVLQTAQIVMNMLDITIPGVLKEEKKKKVLTAVGQGETIMKALQDVVPEDVRGKLTASVSAILHAQNTNLKLDRLLDIGKVPAISPGIESKSEAEATLKDPHISDEMKVVDTLADGSDNSQPGSDNSATGQDPDLHCIENLNESSDIGQPQLLRSQQGDTSSSSSKGTSDLGNNHENDELIKEKDLVSDSNEKGKSAKPNIDSLTEKTGGTEEASANQEGGTPQLETKKQSTIMENEEKSMNSSSDQSKTVSGNIAEEAPSPAESSTDSQPMEREGSENYKTEIKTESSVPDQHRPTVSDSNPPTFNVSEAFDALTGMDDSTQVAVNSVFGVIEDMISQLEEEKDDENKSEAGDKIEDDLVDSTQRTTHANSDHLLSSNGKNELGAQSIISNDSSVDKNETNDFNPQTVVSNEWVKEEPAKNSISDGENSRHGSQGSTISNYEIEEGTKKTKLIGGKFLANHADRHVNSIPLYISANSYRDYLQNEYLRRFLLSKMPNSKPLDLDTTTALLLDYFPEDGQWKLWEQPGIIGESTNDVTTDDSVNRRDQVHHFAKLSADNYIEPSYVLLETDKQSEPVEEYSTEDHFQVHAANGDDRLEELRQFVKNIILDALKVEIDRKLSPDDMKEMKSDLSRDLEQVAYAVVLAIVRNKNTLCLQENFSIQSTSQKLGTLQGEDLVKAISSAVQSASYLRRVLPVGVVIGSSLAALRKYFYVGTRHDSVLTFIEQTKTSVEKEPDKSNMEADLKLTHISNKTTSISKIRSRVSEEAELRSKNNDSMMFGAVTAALGASALLVQQQSKDRNIAESSSYSQNEKVNQMKEIHKVDEQMSEKNDNIAASLAEKAMSVAGPVIPTKEDGEVDQERLVSMLADLGQKGGMLRLVGKVALLWGGIRGAVSLTDRLISFLHLAERPLYQRIIGFFGMVLVLWSPVIVPLLPTLVQSWTANIPCRFAELGSIVGLYIAVTILVMQWGRRIRGFNDPLEGYGLDLTKPPKIQHFLISLIGGVMMVLSIQSVNALLGCVCFCWPSSLPTSSLDAMAFLKVSGKIITLAVQGFATATGVVFVEELLFRAWLPEEIAADLGYHQGIIISGLVFSLFQRSLLAIPGLWLFSLALAGFRQRNQGSLSIPIGLRAGIMTSSFILQTGGFLTYKSNYPLWVTGTHLFQPFSGVVGIAFASVLAITYYPRQPL